jgi:hypothetical protein
MRSPWAAWQSGVRVSWDVDTSTTSSCLSLQMVLVFPGSLGISVLPNPVSDIDAVPRADEMRSVGFSSIVSSGPRWAASLEVRADTT